MPTSMTEARSQGSQNVPRIVEDKDRRRVSVIDEIVGSSLVVVPTLCTGWLMYTAMISNNANAILAAYAAIAAGGIIYLTGKVGACAVRGSISYAVINKDAARIMAVGLVAWLVLWLSEWVPVLDATAAASVPVSMGLSLIGAVHMSWETKIYLFPQDALISQQPS